MDMNNNTEHGCQLETTWQVSGFESASHLQGGVLLASLGSLTGHVREKTVVEELLNQIGWAAR